MLSLFKGEKGVLCSMPISFLLFISSQSYFPLFSVSFPFSPVPFIKFDLFPLLI